jgi:hypothetical protein
VVRAEIRQPDEHGINLGFLRHEGGECLAVVSGACASSWGSPVVDLMIRHLLHRI